MSALGLALNLAMDGKHPASGSNVVRS
jgi:hypothetical protein